MAGASHSALHSELRIAIDTGGTFTDCVWVEGGALKTLKVFSTPDDPSRAIAEALRKIAKLKDAANKKTGDGDRGSRCCTARPLGRTLCCSEKALGSR